MATTYYHTVDGEIQGETTNGVRTDYLTDALGSVVATVNQSAQVVNTYRYKPYGERLAKTGVGADPRFGWTGDTGSRRTARSFAEQYNRARHYGAGQGGWTAVDRRWPERSAYVYAASSPVRFTDRFGEDLDFKGNCGDPWGETGQSIEKCFTDMCRKFRDITASQRNAIRDCISNNPPAPSNLLDLLEKACKTPAGDPPQKFCVFCRGPGGSYGLPPECAWMEQVCSTIKPGFEQIGYSCPPVPPLPAPGGPPSQEQQCKDALNKLGCACGTVICAPGVVVAGEGGSPACCRYAPFHELTHCLTNFSHGPGDQIRNPDWLTKVSHCICEVFYGSGQCGCLGLQ